MNWEVRTMRSMTSCFNPTLYRKTMLRFWPLWGLYGLLWMFVLPLRLLNEYFDMLRWDSTLTEAQEWLSERCYQIPEALVGGAWISAFFAILAAMACFSYLYSTRSACMMHALPLRREGLFLTQYLAGLSFFLLPHLADRSEIYEIGYHGDRPDVDYVVIDARYSGWQDTMRAYLAQDYEIQTNAPGLLVILRSPG